MSENNGSENIMNQEAEIPISEDECNRRLPPIDGKRLIKFPSLGVKTNSNWPNHTQELLSIPTRLVKKKTSVHMNANGDVINDEILLSERAGQDGSDYWSHDAQGEPSRKDTNGIEELDYFIPDWSPTKAESVNEYDHEKFDAKKSDRKIQKMQDLYKN